MPQSVIYYTFLQIVCQDTRIVAQGTAMHLGHLIGPDAKNVEYGFLLVDGSVTWLVGAGPVLMFGWIHVSRSSVK
jgi:hypothetical protein